MLHQVRQAAGDQRRGVGQGQQRIEPRRYGEVAGFPLRLKLLLEMAQSLEIIERVLPRIDLLVEEPNGWVLLDHKSNPGGAARDEDLAAKHGPQIESYGHALLSATGKPMSQGWLYLPVAARAVRLSCVPSSPPGSAQQKHEETQEWM